MATAILAGVIATILVPPRAARANVPGFLRYGALPTGFVRFVLTRRSIFGGVVCGRDAHREVVVGLMRRNCGAAIKR